METYPTFSTFVIPRHRHKTSITEAEGRFIFDLIRAEGLRRTLEIGFGYGVSAAYMLAATNETHVAIEPHLEGYEGYGIRNVERLGLAGKLEIVESFSYAALSALLLQRRSFDFIFIDGSHKFDDIFIDWYFADKLLSLGGYIVFHDAETRTTSLVTSFVRKNRSDYEWIRTPHKGIAVLKKIGADRRPWHHFREFFTLKGIANKSWCLYKKKMLR